MITNAERLIEPHRRGKHRHTHIPSASTVLHMVLRSNKNARKNDNKTLIFVSKEISFNIYQFCCHILAKFNAEFLLDAVWRHSDFGQAGTARYSHHYVNVCLKVSQFIPWKFPKCNELIQIQVTTVHCIWLSFVSYKIVARHIESPWKYAFVPRAEKCFPEKVSCNGNHNRFRDAELRRSIYGNSNILEMCWMPKVSQSDNSSVEFPESSKNTRIYSSGATSVPAVTVVIPSTTVYSSESNGQLSRNRCNQSWSISMEEEYLCPVDQQSDSQQWTSVCWCWAFFARKHPPKTTTVAGVRIHME